MPGRSKISNMSSVGNILNPLFAWVLPAPIFLYHALLVLLVITVRVHCLNMEYHMSIITSIVFILDMIPVRMTARVGDSL